MAEPDLGPEGLTPAYEGRCRKMAQPVEADSDQVGLREQFTNQVEYVVLTV
jgi:hypothetical protein